MIETKQNGTTRMADVDRSFTAIKELQPAGIRLKAHLLMGSLNVELTLDPHVYLHKAELILDSGVHARIVPFGLKDAHTAVWRQLGSDAGAQVPLSFSIAWRAIATDKPGTPYDATITVRDVRCVLLETFPSTENPSRWRGQIGPADNPTDVGQVAVKVGL
jgi:hypothetical protein